MNKLFAYVYKSYDFDFHSVTPKQLAIIYFTKEISDKRFVRTPHYDRGINESNSKDKSTK